MKSHVFASRALAFQDEKRKTELREQLIGELPIAKRISMARAGLLEEAADNCVREQLDLEVSQC